MNKTAAVSRIFLTGIIVAIASAFADITPSPLPLIELIRRQYNPGTPLETNFSLSIYWSVREKEEKKQGAFILAPGDRFRVTLGNETFVSNGTTLWSHNGKANQVVVKALADVDLALHPSRLFTTTIGSYPFRESRRKGGITVLLWDRDSSTAAWTSIRLWVQTATGTIFKCVLTDRNNNIFTYSFSGTVFGKKTSPGAFEFVIPKNARVVDSRK